VGTLYRKLCPTCNEETLHDGAHGCLRCAACEPFSFENELQKWFTKEHLDTADQIQFMQWTLALALPERLSRQQDALRQKHEQLRALLYAGGDPEASCYQQIEHDLLSAREDFTRDHLTWLKGLWAKKARYKRPQYEAHRKKIHQQLRLGRERWKKACADPSAKLAVLPPNSKIRRATERHWDRLLKFGFEPPKRGAAGRIANAQKGAARERQAIALLKQPNMSARKLAARLGIGERQARNYMLSLRGKF
jgi:DNA-binding CsgD family transcriptional regulator